MKYNNCLFQRRQDQHPRQHMIFHAPTISTSSQNSHLEVVDMQIDMVRIKILTPKEKKQRMEGGLCLHCGEEGHRAENCLKKQNRRTIKTRGAFVQENKDA